MEEEKSGAYHRQTKEQEKSSAQNKSGGFECNICVSDPTDPVVTR
jgi:hypothetical protein